MSVRFGIGFYTDRQIHMYMPLSNYPTILLYFAATQGTRLESEVICAYAQLYGIFPLQPTHLVLRNHFTKIDRCFKCCL